MNKEFEKLYREWKVNTMFLSSGLHDNGWWKNLSEWSKSHPQEAKEGIIEILEQEPNHVVRLCSELWGDLDANGYLPLDAYCNTWLNILKGENDFFKDNYKEYREYVKYMDDNYIPWNPFTGDGDPNVTFKEFKEGKRNKEASND